MIIIQEKLADGISLYGWECEPPLTPVAPSDTHYLTEKIIFSEEECKEWSDYLLEQEPILLDRFRTSSGDGLTGLPDTSITSRFSQVNLLNSDFHLVPKLKTEILNGIKTIISIFDKTNWQETLYAQCWFNVLRQGESMNAHIHSYEKYTFYGFHLTINATETFTSYYHPMSPHLSEKPAFHSPNNIGILTLFPNYIPHSVSRNRYETPRISIAGDIYPSTIFDDPTDRNTGNLVEIGTYNNNNELQETK